MKTKKATILLMVFVLITFSTLAVTLLISENASAHAPAAIYPIHKEGTLTVYIDHPSDEPGTHYIKTVTVFVNRVEVLSETYTSQTVDEEKGKGLVTYSYNVSASDGDVISVTAECSIDGDITETLTVGSSDGKDDPKDYPDKDDPTRDDPDNVGDSNKDGDSSQDNGEIIMLLGAIIGVLVVIAVLVAMLLKKQKGTTEKGATKIDKIKKDEWTSCPKCGSSIKMEKLPAHLDTVHTKLTQKTKNRMIEDVMNGK